MIIVSVTNQDTNISYTKIRQYLSTGKMEFMKPTDILKEKKEKVLFLKYLDANMKRKRKV
jgi:hypothetical protein